MIDEVLPYATNHELYDAFYRTACQYIHVDIMSAKSYFTVIDSYDEIDPSLIAVLIALVITSLLLSQISRNNNAQDLFRTDTDNLCKNLNLNFKKCFEIIECDPEHSSAIFDILLQRLEQELDNER